MAEYPKHCIGCWKESECKQKYFMLADTEPVQGFVGCADTWCEDCAPDNADSYGYYPEVDIPMHCSGCGRPLQCSLTDYGVEYVKEAIAEADGCCRELWPTLFADYLED